MKKIFTLIATALMTMGASAEVVQVNINESGASTIPAGTVLSDNECFTATTTFDTSACGLKDDGVTPNGAYEYAHAGLTFPAWIDIRVNDEPSAENPNGTANKTSVVIVAKKNATLSAYLRTGNNKEVKLFDQSTFEVLSSTSAYTEDGSSNNRWTWTWNIEAGKTYVLTEKGGTGRLSGFTYEITGGGDEPIIGGPKTIGIVRPLIPGDNRVYDDFAYITTDDFNQKADGLNVSFYQSPELLATLAEDAESESGYAVSSLRYRGAGYNVDYVWKIQCKEFDDASKKHNAETLGSENYTFGFDLTVAAGQQFAVSALELDLLLEQNPSWRLRIVKSDNTELYNSTWVTKTGGYNSAQWGAGWYGRFTTTEVSFNSGNNADGLQYYPCLETPEVAIIPANLVLTEGSYKVLCDIDYNNENVKGISFDHLTIEGTLEAATGISSTTAEKVVKNSAIYNLAGQRVSAPVKGQIYIQNGKKFIQK